MRKCQLCLLFVAIVSVGALPLMAGELDYNRDVQPILSNNCFFCHGPDANHRAADLRLDLREQALKGEAIVPGKPDASHLISRILSTDPDEQMPPPSSNKRLTDHEKQILKQWIAEGAEYQLHWSYVPPVKAEIPAGQNGVDVLVQQRLKNLGMEFSAPADRRVLIRRLYSDLVGLPPTPAEVQAFVEDQSPEAYSKVVDKLLASPHYGERMAIGWLDVVRYADTIGYHSDTPRNVWPYRDWVIRSFNQNKPFDQFTLEQVAGDLLPDANQETKVGSAFNRLLLSTEEGGAQAKDYEARMLTDRVRAIGTVWLGQTTGCAQCHDHKFDPISMRDFYSLGAFFADIQEPILGRREEGMLVTTPEEQQQLAALDATLNEARGKFNAIAPQLQAAQQQWEEDVARVGASLFAELAEGSQASAAEMKNAEQILALVKKAEKDRNPREKDQLQAYYRSKVCSQHKEEQAALAKAEGERNAYYNSLAKCLVSISSSNPRTVRILPRGNWMDDSGEVMQPALPHYLPGPETADRKLTRLDLAQWLVSRDNPLTARTTMNRLWKQFFGIGLSKVLDDLGAQGEPPVNGPLLDWLACEFMDSGWDMKHMVRTIVMSRAYQQTSVASPELLAADPQNRECARQTAFRVDAELVRDNALAVAGLLVDEIGGLSAKPYQPEGYWENLNFPQRTYVADLGAEQYRRGLYTWWQRSFLHPSMLAFDAPSREECAAERNRSNIPQQALVLLNDPTYVESARVFAARIVKEAPATTPERIQWAWQQVLQRPARPEEVQVMEELLTKHQAAYQQAPESAAALLRVGLAPVDGQLDKIEVATWTHVARVLLNLHETVTRS